MKTTSHIIKVATILLFSSLFMIGCSEEQKIEKRTKVYSYFYPTENVLPEKIKQETIYIPVYSHVYTSEEKYERMGITLSIRNTDTTKDLWVKNISYYNTGGDLIETYINTLHILKPMASIDFVINLSDMRGGSGANFIIEWAGEEELSTPIIQAVMVNNSGNRAFSFITNGHTIQSSK